METIGPGDQLRSAVEQCSLERFAVIGAFCIEDAVDDAGEGGTAARGRKLRCKPGTNVRR